MNHPVFQKYVAIPVTALGVCLGIGNLLTALAQTDPAEQNMQYSNNTKKVLYINSPDYPPDPMQYPQNPTKKTEFWKEMDRALTTTRNLTITENLEQADYRVNIKCGGIIHCSKLKVYIESPKRDVLASYTLPNIKKVATSDQPKPISNTASRLAATLQEHIDKLQQGGYGYSN